MGTTHFSGVQCSPVTIDVATITLNEWDHSGRTLVLNRAGGITVTLPAATGSGATYNFFILTTFTSSLVIQVDSSSAYMNGVAHVANDTDASASLFETANSGSAATESDTITMNGTTTGGYVGTVIQLQDVAANRWSVMSSGAASGVEATPFSAAV